MTSMADAPLIVHLIYRLDFGGLENLLVERINRIPATRYRHAVVCLTGYTDFAARITQPGVTLHTLDKPPGLALATHAALWRLLRQLRPAIVHTYNLATVEYAAVALLAGVPIRINGLHGRDAGDPTGSNRKHNFLRRAMLPFYDGCYANSADMAAWNRDVIGVPEAKNHLLANGIDTARFTPRDAAALAGVAPPPGWPASFDENSFVIASVGRIQAVKDQASLVAAFVLLRRALPALQGRLRLAIVGDGPLLPQLRAQVAAAGVEDQVWLPGARSDIAAILARCAVFALPSIAEGTPGAALEAMAAGLPVVGSRVGGVPEVVADGVTGYVVPPSDPAALAGALGRYAAVPALADQHGAAGRARVLERYGMEAMVAGYVALYDRLCQKKLKNRYSSSTPSNDRTV